MQKTLIIIPLFFIFTYALEISISDSKNVQIGNTKNPLCSGLQMLTAPLEQENEKDHICIADSSKTFDQLWTAMNIAGSIVGKEIAVSYKGRLYLFPKADANNSDDSLQHTIILTDENLIEGTSNGWGKSISRKKIKTKAIDDFIVSMERTVSANGTNPINSHLNIGFIREEDVRTVFYIIDKITGKGWKYVYLVLTRESSTDIDSSSCLNTLMGELLYEPKMKKAGLVGGRSKTDIAGVVNEHVSALRYHYHEWLKNNDKKTGKITVKMKIDNHGRVVESEIVDNTFNDKYFESLVLKEIKKWRFGKINQKNDMTEIIYPFIFEE